MGAASTTRSPRTATPNVAHGSDTHTHVTRSTIGVVADPERFGVEAERVVGVGVDEAVAPPLRAPGTAPRRVGTPERFVNH